MEGDDQKVVDLLGKVAGSMLPARERLISALKGVDEPRPALLIISTYMSSYMKLGIALAAIIVIGGGALLMSSPSGSLTMETNTDTSADASTDTVARTEVVAEPTAATGSIDDLALAMSGELAAETAGVAAFDAAVAAESSSLTSTNDLTYDQGI